jgi:hypothetical protein
MDPPLLIYQSFYDAVVQTKFTENVDNYSMRNAVEKYKTKYSK